MKKKTYYSYTKIWCMLLLLCFLVPLKAFAQQQRTSVNINNLPLKEAVQQIATLHSLNVAYSKEFINPNTKVSLNVTDITLESALSQLLKGTEIGFKFMNGNILLFNKESQGINDKSTVQQVRMISTSGVVSDENGEPVIGAAVIVPGTQIGTVTDFDGRFSLKVQEGSTLEISYLSYATEKRKVTSSSPLLITLNPSTELLDEVVVVGYGTQKKVNLTGSVSTVSSDKLKNRPITNISTGLQGLVPGMTVISNNNGGLPGQSNATIRVRGTGTIANSSPLVLIDGVEGSMDLINPNDIENISVLKDAASASIYGNKAANGVILITTKSVSGIETKPTITFNTYLGIQTPTNLPKMADAPTYMAWDMEANANVGEVSAFTEDDIQKVINQSDPNYYANTDWIDAIYRSAAPQQNYNLSIDGKAKNMGYLFSYGMLNQEGLLVGNSTESKRHNLRLKLNTKVADIITLNANIGYIDRKHTSPNAGFNAASGIIYNAMRTSPTTPVRFTDGNWGYGGGQTNQVALLHDGGGQEFTSQEFTGNFSAKVDILKGWTASTTYSVRKVNSLRELLTKELAFYRPETDDIWTKPIKTSSFENRDYTTSQQTFFAQTDYDLKIKKHSMHVMLGFQQEWNKSKSFSAKRDSLTTEKDPVIDFGLESMSSASGGGSQWAMRSGFGRINYNYDERYLFEANLRYDLTSRFIKENRGGWFPSFSAAWRLSEENFMQNTKEWLDQLKLRASWGILGNQYSSSNNYPYLSVIGNVNVPTIGTLPQQGYSETIIGNPNLLWEKSYNTNIGFDMSVLNNRLNISGDFFIRKTKDIIYSKVYPGQNGYTSIEENGGIVKNTGWELQFNWNDKIGNDFSYGAIFSISDVKNKLTKFGDPQYSGYNQSYITKEGYALNSLYGLVSEGLAMPTDFEYYDATSGKYMNPKFAVMPDYAGTVQPGDIKYKDLNGDGIIDLDNDREVVGNSFPRYTYSFNGYLNWKNFDFSFLIQGVGKADGYIYGPARHAFNDQSTYPQKFHSGRYQASNPNPNASYPRFTYNDEINSRNFSTFWKEDASYLRLKNIEIGYSLPKNLIQKIRLERCRFYASADNVFTSTKYLSTYDPETPVQGGGYYPQVRTFVFGFNITFK